MVAMECIEAIAFVASVKYQAWTIYKKYAKNAAKTKNKNYTTT